MRPLEIGLVLPLLEDPPSGDKPTWDTIRGLALRAEELGFDTVWVPDELYWAPPSWPGPRGFWECVAMTGAVAAVTSKVKVGTWVLSALHRNPGLTAKAAETLDEISGGRFIFGFGSGHAGAQGKAFGFPDDRTVGRYAEALEIVVSLLRDGEADYEGEYHAARQLGHRPVGPRPGGIPIMLGGHKQRTIGLAVRHGDIWSAFAEESSKPEAFVERLTMVDQTCADQGRDPSTLGRSVGVFVETDGLNIAEEVGLGVPLSGSVEQIVDAVHEFARLGVTMLELSPFPEATGTLEVLAEVLAVLDR